jgi:hypothetical protein
MTCEVVKLPGGSTAIVCGRGGPRPPRCKFCPLPYAAHKATLLCDFEIGRTLGGEPITCDAKICTGCARRVGDKDFCPKHPK